MAANPSQQIKQLAIGTAISLIAMLALVLSSDFENVWLFYFLSLVTALGILYAIPGYIGIWIWRMKDIFLKDVASKK
jgi:multisubunit Na+/H+ antiporter MnhG subunit